MIGRIQGILLQKNPPQLLVDCQGVGYEIDVPMSTFYNLPAVGEKVTLFTHLAIREDAHVLYGFGSLDERALFRQLIRISGVGARTALALLSGLSVNDMSQAVALQDASRLTSIPGIGKKTAERLLLELKGKLETGALSAISSSVQNDAMADIQNALLALGYSEKETILAIKQVPNDCSVSDGIKMALKALSKG
ncbi:Holliday junction branch migration protein RuvA [Oxalobacter formigenes]|uniref:Holliday junction branch migration complex subunit RuvA n=1 Tax=Oxalobacter formigenes OXCC13 TaxID=556269 RepID=C3XB57_OXAFO|nr:Holliday junction branch migration protein RuvA [Oxalobacter formigenes]ARQ45405.1 Holliday junction ATP-dependent DNA helicase RuvA [Oxalobacter formigenes]ARQ77686.1 Holliday junction branch migration protein RuvA [Oxalobacter formigenes OXCC13]EEO30433.1 Holliday junction DNA helicase RuvA [Oxalobacter formigenes OXCC13]MCZ4063425.1 Holliday junction branch migration protein RuvA [Oxalobacter formigenes]QDX33776.1 Holliday junction branch migration protein RuvA [Oxalobacter formigenes]